MTTEMHDIAVRHRVCHHVFHKVINGIYTSKVFDVAFNPFDVQFIRYADIREYRGNLVIKMFDMSLHAFPKQIPQGISQLLQAFPRKVVIGGLFFLVIVAELQMFELIAKTELLNEVCDNLCALASAELDEQFTIIELLHFV